MKTGNKILTFILACLFVLAMAQEIAALNVTDDLDMNNGTILNVSRIESEVGVWPGALFKLDGNLQGDPSLFDIDMTTTQAVSAPFNFLVDYTGTVSGTALVTEGAAKASQLTSNFAFVGYADRRTLGSGSGSLTTGSRHFEGYRVIGFPPFLAGGDWTLYGGNKVAYNIVNLAGTSDALDVGWYTEPPTNTLELGTVNLDVRGFECGDYTNTSAYDSSWCFYSPYAGSYHYINGTLWLGNLTNGTDTVQTNQLIDTANSLTDIQNMTRILLDDVSLMYNFYDDGAELFLNSTTAESLGMETENAKLQLFNEPTAGNGWKVFEVFHKSKGSETGMVMYQAGPNNATYFKRSVRIGGNGGSACAVLDPNNLVDCNTTAKPGNTGSDLVIADQLLALGGGIFGNNTETVNLSNGGINGTGNLSNTTDTVSFSDIIDAVKNPADTFVYSDWFNNTNLNTTGNPTFNSTRITNRTFIDWIISHTTDENRLRLFNPVTGCMDFNIGDILMLELCTDGIEWSEDMIPSANNSYLIGDNVGNWWLGGYFGETGLTTIGPIVAATYDWVINANSTDYLIFDGYNLSVTQALLDAGGGGGGDGQGINQTSPEDRFLYNLTNATGNTVLFNWTMLNESVLDLANVSGYSGNISTGKCNLEIENGLIKNTTCPPAGSIISDSDVGAATSFNDILFYMQFMIFLGVLLAKIYNVFRKGEFYDIKVTWIMFIVLVLFYGLGLALNLLAAGSGLLVPVLFRLESFFLVLLVLFTIIELFFYLSRTAVTSQPAGIRR
jgi:hypothetical protein